MPSIAILVIALPWLNPFTPGPTPAFVSWVLALAAISGLILWTSFRPRPPDTAFPRRLAAAAAWGWLLAGLVSSVIGLLQYFGMSDVMGPWVNKGLPGEAFGNLRQRNQFASLTNIALVALVALVWLKLGPERGFGAQRQWLTWIAAALLVAGNAASASRTGMIQIFLFCAMCAVWRVWHQPALRRVLVVAVLVYFLASVALPWLAGLDLLKHGIVARLHTGGEGCASRLTLWSNVFALIADKPWFGWGWGGLDYAHYMTIYAGQRFCDILDNAHNLPLHLAVELGVPFALGVCGALFGVVVRARPWRETDPTRQMAWSILALILLHSLLEYPLWYGPFQVAAGVCVYMLWATREQPAAPLRSTPGEEPDHTVAKYFLAVTAALMMALAAYGAWDYRRVSQVYLSPAKRDPAYRDNTLEKIGDTLLFRSQYDFAALSMTPLTPENALKLHVLGTDMLHYSPEPRVIEKVIESAVMLGRDDEALLHLARYRAAFPVEYTRWRSSNRLPEGPAE
jgi:O-antigen ligase